MNLLDLKYVVRLGIVLGMLLCLLPTAVSAAEAEAPVFRAGAARANITPPLGCDIVGNFEVPKATYVHDDLHARCLALDDGTVRLVIVLCDNLGTDQHVFDEAKRRLQEDTGIPPEHLLMAATHTHSGPTARISKCPGGYTEFTPYQQFMVDRIVDGVQCALKNLEPAEIAWGQGEEADQVNNRRWYLSDPSLMVSPFGAQDQVRMNPPRAHKALVEPAGPTDPGIVFLAVRSVDGRPIALLANYSLHYVGGVPGGHISADYFGVFADRIQQLLDADRLNPPFVGMMSNGTSGDINNINFRAPSPKRAPYEQMHRVANIVAAEVFRVYQTVEFKSEVKLGGRMARLTLPVRKPNEEQVQWAHETLAQPKDDVGVVKRSYAHRTLNLLECPDQVDVWVQALRIGDAGIAGIPFETFAETGLRLKAEGPLPVTFTISQANGGFGYLPTPAQHALGGYETWLGTSKVAEESEPAIVDTLFRQFAELAAE